MASNNNQSATNLGPPVNVTWEQIQKLVETAVQAANKPNIVDQKRIDEQIEREKRLAQLHVVMAREEQEREERKKNSCSHSRDKEGNGAPKGQGIWTTGGQFTGEDGDVTLICMRCCQSWTWTPTRDERIKYQNLPNGLLGIAPPSADRCANRG